jgi:hypothetical protein
VKRASWLACWIGIAALCPHPPARAGDGHLTRAALRAPACPIDGVAEADLRAALGLELGAQGIELLPATKSVAPSDAEVSIRHACTAVPEVELEASWSGERRARRLNVAALPQRARTRTLALALAEMLGSFIKIVDPEQLELDETEDADEVPSPSRPEPEPKPEPTAPLAPSPVRVPTRPPVDREPGPEDRGPSAPSARGAEVGVSPEGRLFVDGETVLGMRPHVDFGLFGIGLSVLGTSTTVATGRVSALVVQGALSLRVLQSPSAELVSVTAGPRLGAGLVRVSGSGTEGVVGLAASEPYFDAGAYAMFELRPQPTLRLGLGFELGYAAGVVALSNTDPVATYGGPFVGALLDVSLAL